MNLNDLLLPAVNASVEAGRKINQVQKFALNIRIKQDNSPVTVADMEAQKIILNYLNNTDLPVISEESENVDYKLRKNFLYYWLVDPLDGTKEFINNRDGYTVNIALIKKDTPVAGVIYAPAMDELFFNFPGDRSYKIINPVDKYISAEDLKIASEPISTGEEKDILRIVASKSHLNEKTNQFIEDVSKLVAKTEIINIGSSLKFCLIAEGKADIYPRFGPTMEWDTGAGHAIAEAAGCEVLKSENLKPLVYNKLNLKNPEFVVFRVPSLYEKYHKLFG